MTQKSECRVKMLRLRNVLCRSIELVIGARVQRKRFGDTALPVCASGISYETELTEPDLAFRLPARLRWSRFTSPAGASSTTSAISHSRAELRIEIPRGLTGYLHREGEIL